MDLGVFDVSILVVMVFRMFLELYRHLMEAESAILHIRPVVFISHINLSQPSDLVTLDCWFLHLRLFSDQFENI